MKRKSFLFLAFELIAFPQILFWTRALPHAGGEAFRFAYVCGTIITAGIAVAIGIIGYNRHGRYGLSDTVVAVVIGLIIYGGTIPLTIWQITATDTTVVGAFFTFSEIIIFFLFFMLGCFLDDRSCQPKPRTINLTATQISPQPVSPQPQHSGRIIDLPPELPPMLEKPEELVFPDSETPPPPLPPRY